MASNGQHTKAVGRGPRIWDGRYRVERTLGEGGMGQVTLARDLLLGERPVAVKMLLPAFRSSTSGFMREYAVQRRLDHPAIPRVYDFGFGHHAGAEVPYFVMDYVRGIPLEDALLKRPDPATKNGWVAQALRGLDHLHRAGFLHRDMKPSNMLVTLEGPVETSAHIIDFGISIPFDETPEEYFIGTPEYSAPELMSGAAFEPRQDLYAIGLLIYELIAGTRPWLSDDAVELYRKRIGGDYPPLPQTCSPRLATLVADLLHAKPSRRPASAAEVLERFIDATATTPQSAQIESAVSFRRRVQKVEFAASETFQAASTTWLETPSVLLVEDPPGFDGVQLMHQLTDAAAVRGARVIRYALESRAHAPLEAIEPALEIVRRVRNDASAALPGIAGAATLLARLATPLVIAIEGLGWADARSLELLTTVFTGARNPGLHLIATFDPRQGAIAESAFDRLARLPVAHLVERARLSLEVARQWLDAAVGVDVVPADQVEALWQRSEGRPQRLRELVTEEVRRAVLVRKRDGFVWNAEQLPRDARSQVRMSQPVLLAVTARQTLDDLSAILDESVPEGVISTFLGVPSERVRGYIADGLLARDVWGSVMVGPRAVAPVVAAAARPLLHERLARAIELAPAFDGKAERAAREWLRSPDPLRAVLHLVEAAQRAALHRGDALPRAALLLGEAQEVLEVEETAIGALAGSEGYDSEHAIARLQGLRIDVSVAHLGLARALGDWPIWRHAAVDLIARSVAADRGDTMALALDALLHLAADRGADAEMLKHAHAVAELSPEGASALCWALARLDRAEGKPEAALARIHEALAAPSSPAWRMALMALEAEILTRLGWIEQGTRSIAAYAALAAEASDRRAVVHAALLSAKLAREAQTPDKALAELRRLAAELGDDRCYRIDGRLEVELARAHLAFGWLDTARLHAQQGVALAWRDGDREAVLFGRLCHARVEALRGAAADAMQIVDQARLDVSNLDRPALRELEYAEIEVAFAGGASIALDRLLSAARRLATAAEAEGMRGLALRTFTLAARIATALGQGDAAVALALTADERSRQWGAVGVPKHHILFILARARDVRRDPFRAQRSLARAQAELASATRLVRDSSQRAALLDEPTNRLITRGDMSDPSPLGLDLHPPRDLAR